MRNPCGDVFAPDWFSEPRPIEAEDIARLLAAHRASYAGREPSREERQREAELEVAHGEIAAGAHPCGPNERDPRAVEATPNGGKPYYFTISDHALVRWIERIGRVNLDRIREIIRRDTETAMRARAKSCIGEHGARYKLDPASNTVVTVTDEDMRSSRPKPRRSPRDFRQYDSTEDVEG